MAKGKKSKGTHYVSKGAIGTNKALSKAIRRDYVAKNDPINKLNAFTEGRNVVFTIPNPNPKETNKRFVKRTGKELFGDYREFGRWEKANNDSPKGRKKEITV